MDVLTLVLLFLIIVMGMTVPNMQFISLIGGIIMATYIFGAREDHRPPAPAGGIKVRPIVVQRRYVGPDSIYPQEMKMRVNPAWDSRPWFEQASAAAGQFAGFVANTGKPSRPKD
ncbi:hypothetical protein K8R43_04090 [archaeon]|nr:hypothetical protein [archaeon]